MVEVASCEMVGEMSSTRYPILDAYIETVDEASTELASMNLFNFIHSFFSQAGPFVLNYTRFSYQTSHVLYFLVS